MSEELENVIAVISCAALGTLGILANGICSILLLQIKTYKTAFGYLTLFHSSANAVLISSYLFWVAPHILWNFRDLLIVNRTVGQITMIAQAASYLSILLLSYRAENVEEAQEMHRCLEHKNSHYNKATNPVTGESRLAANVAGLQEKHVHLLLQVFESRVS
ncbi:hypothetical protein KIN20_007642 [Parelaphostrongylus tenuis]|uniref:7TM GPCR serpentine receptor class x (Srx) domain-containing protein n=1 Tax=Parelaphostrongylus tenuis TaxID=148309 RepID=A0AAD5QHZ2_PARTN|nr:hypothetical protein KIN20_007642 [Parelaphostrongylus tenuis]